MEQVIEVHAILLNNVLGRYSLAGVKYVEFSVSMKDLQNYEIFSEITTNVFDCQQKAKSRKKNSADVHDDAVVTSETTDVDSFIGNDNIEQPTVANGTFKDAHDDTTLAQEASGLDLLIENNVISTGIDATVVRNQTARDVKQKKAVAEEKFLKLSLDTTISLPSWRKFYTSYNSKTRNQTYGFLAASNRTKVKYPKFVEQEQKLKLEPTETFLASDGISLLYDLVTDTDRIRRFLVNEKFENFKSDTVIEEGELLLRFAKYLCQDSILAVLFPDALKQFSEFKEHYLKNEDMQKYIIGLDWVGDELGFPFCAFAHSDIVEQINKFENINFGIRVHAGEGLLRASTCVPASFSHSSSSSSSSTTTTTTTTNTTTASTSIIDRGFQLHQFILIESIRKIHENLKNKNLRVGHGVAFLFEDESPETTLARELKSFREFLRDKDIPCELNPTSNHMLLSQSFHDRKLTANKALKAFITNEIPVVICTDDDRIWALHKCAEHNRHISVAHEICKCISEGNLDENFPPSQKITNGSNSATNSKKRKRGDTSLRESSEELEKLMSNGKRYAFASRK